MYIKLIVLAAWLIVAWLINDDTSFRDWSIGLVSGVFFADIVITLKQGGRRRHG